MEKYKEWNKMKRSGTFRRKVKKNRELIARSIFEAESASIDKQQVVTSINTSTNPPSPVKSSSPPNIEHPSRYPSPVDVEEVVADLTEEYFSPSENEEEATEGEILQVASK